MHWKAGRQAGRQVAQCTREGKRARGRAGEREREGEGGTGVNSVWIGGAWSRLIRF